MQTSLSPDLLVIIISFLDDSTWCRFAYACRSFHRLARDDTERRKTLYLIKQERVVRDLLSDTRVWNLYDDCKNSAMNFSADHDFFQSDWMPFYRQFESWLSYSRAVPRDLPKILKRCIALQPSRSVRRFLSLSFYGRGS